MTRFIPNPKFLCCASIFALSLTACSHHGEKFKTDAKLAGNVGNESVEGLFKLKKGHRTKRLGGKLPDPRSYDNLWDRLFDRFDLPEIAHHDVDRELNWFINHPNYIERVQSRAEPFLYSIVKQLEKHNLPGELALLPVIESAFQPHAVSPANAAGIWQFIPATGRHYGLKQSRSYDGRRDIYASTRAAIKYLKKLHNDFNGDWLLAIAGYNCGEGAVSRAIQRNIARGLPTDFWSLDLPQETRSYVPRLLAVAKLFSESDTYGISLRPIPNQPLYKTVKMNSQVDLALAANAADISLNKLLELNPGFKRQHVDLDGSYRLFIPAHKKIVDFKEELARQIAMQGYSENIDPNGAGTGDPNQANLSADFKPIEPPSAGTNPEPPRAVSDPAIAVSAVAEPPAATVPPVNPEIEASPQPPTQTEAFDRASETALVQAQTADNPKSSTNNAPESYSTEPPITLAKFESKDYGAEPELKLTDYETAPVVNSRDRDSAAVSPKGLRKGQTGAALSERKKAAEKVAMLADTKAEQTADRMAQKNGQKKIDEPVTRKAVAQPDYPGKKTAYVIQAGDTVYSIARKYDMDVDDLKKMNGIARPDDIKWGQSMTVVNKDTGKKPSVSGKTGTSIKASPATRYTAHEGETLFSISRRFNVTVADLRKWNGIKEDKQFRAGMNISVSGEKN